MFVAAAAVALAVRLAADPQAAEPPPDAAPPPVSLERIREALQRPRLVIPPPESLPTFRTSIEDKSPAFESVLEGMRRDLARWSGAGSAGPQAPDTNSIPGNRTQVRGVDVLPLLSAVKKKWAEAKAERVRRDVSEELAAFCTVNDCTVLEGGVTTAPEGVIVPPTPD